MSEKIPLWYRLGIFLQGGRTIRMIEKSSTGRTARVVDSITGREFMLALVDMYPHTRRGDLVDWVSNCRL